MGPDFTGPSSTSRTVKPEIDTQGGHARDFSRPLRSVAPKRGSVGQIGGLRRGAPAVSSGADRGPFHRLLDDAQPLFHHRGDILRSLIRQKIGDPNETAATPPVPG